MISKRQWIARETAQILNFKLRAEKTFKPEIKRYFAQFRKNDLENPPTIKPVFQKQYERVVSRLLEGKKQVDTDELQRRILLNLEGRIESDALLADQTTSEDVQAALAQAREEAGPGATEAAITAVAIRIFGRYARARVETIAMTETQAATEMSRKMITDRAHEEIIAASNVDDLASATAAADLAGDYRSASIVDRWDNLTAEDINAEMAAAQKTWSTVGDSKVRTSHMAINGQTRPYNQTFTTGLGSLMMFPGDSSMGAPVKDFINCRCSASYT